MGLGAEIVGVGAWFAPWERWPRRVTLVLAPLAFSLLASSVLLGSYNRSTTALHFMLVFAWIGVSHERGTALAAAPLAAASYLLPLLATGNSDDAITSVWEVVALDVLVGEGLSWMSTRLRRAEALDVSRMWDMQSLLQAAERLAREHDPRHTPELVATLGQQLLRAEGGTVVPAMELPAELGARTYGSVLLLPLRGSAGVQGLFAGGHRWSGLSLEKFAEHASRTFATRAALALERVRSRSRSWRTHCRTS